MKKIMQGWVLIAMALVLSGCPYVYQPSSIIIPQHIKTLGLHPIQNKTSFFGLEDKFFVTLQEEFTRGGQYALIPEENADGVVVVSIERYINQPVSYDVNLVVQERKLWVLVNVSFWDRIQNKILWTEENMEGVERYFVETRPNGISEEQAREIIWDKLSRDIYKRVIDGFGSVTGASERIVPKGEAGRSPLPQ